MNEIIHKTSLNRVQFIGDGNLTQFYFNFYIFEISDIEVYIDEQRIDKGFKIDLDIDNKGSIIFDQAPLLNSKITIARNLSIERKSGFQEGGALRAKVLNEELDYQVACLQQLTDAFNRSMSLPVYGKNINLELPTPQKGRAILWNSEANGLINSINNIDELEKSLQETLITTNIKTQQCIEKALEVQDNKEIVLQAQNDITYIANNFRAVDNTLYQASKQIETSDITLEDNMAVYIKTITSDITLSFDTSLLSKTDKIITFELILNINKIVSIIFPNTTQWLDGITPNLSNTGSYLLVFRSFDNGNNWIGSIQGKWR